MTTAGIGMTAATKTQQTTLEASTSHTSPLNTSGKQSHYYTITNPNRYLARKQHTQHHGTTTARAFIQQFLKEDTTQLHLDIAAATQRQRNKKIEDARSTTTTLWRISSTTLDGYQQEDSCLRHQVCSLQAGQLQDHDALLRL